MNEHKVFYRRIFWIFCHVGIAYFGSFLFGGVLRGVKGLLGFEAAFAEGGYIIQRFYETCLCLLLPIVTRLFYAGLRKSGFHVNRKAFAILLAAVLFGALDIERGCRAFFLGLVVSYVALEFHPGWAYSVCVFAMTPVWTLVLLSLTGEDVTVAMQNIGRFEIGFRTFAMAVGMAVSLSSFLLRDGRKKVRCFVERLLRE